MKNIKTSKIKTCGRRLLSFVLVTALMLGLIPESAYAAGGCFAKSLGLFRFPALVSWNG